MTERSGSWRRERLAAARLYLCVGLRDDLAELLDAALRGGVDVVQLRDPAASRAEQVEAAATFRAAALRHGALFIVNDDPQLAARTGADGVHVGQSDAVYAVARAGVGEDALVGRSTHSAEQLDAALAEPHDYVAIGPVHATPTKEGRAPIGLGPVRHAAQVADRPWFVTGAMSESTLPEARAAGLRAAVVVRAITQADDPEATARRLVALLA